MIIYNKAWLDNLYVRDEGDSLHNAGYITTDEQKNIKKTYPVGFYMPGIFIRCGLFILTFICVTFSAGLVTLMLSQAGVADSPLWLLFLGIVCTVVLEIMVKNNNYYRAGVNDALLWMAAGFLIGAFWGMLDSGSIIYNKPNYLAQSLIVLLIASVFSLRYADRLMSIVACLAFFAALFFTWQKTGSLGNATMPFVIMVAAAAVYMSVVKIAKNIKVPYYNQNLVLLQFTTLVILYAAGNYWVVDELNNMLKGVVASNYPTPIKWAPFFWAWTMLVPVLYLARGIAQKGVLLIRIGLVLFAGAIYTFRTYYHIMSIELALLMGGVIVLSLTYIIVSYLKTPKHGFTYADIDNLATADNIKLEALFTVATFGHKHDAPIQPADKFGGGDFGGGGSGGNF
jgi:hypothetical protein